MTGKVVFSGDLSFNNLAEIFQILGGNNSTGILRITSKYAPSSGIVYFVNGDPVNASNGNLRGLDAVYPLFGWSDGKFEFVQENVQVEHAIKKNRMEIALDALRMLDDGMIKKVGALSLEEMASTEAAEKSPEKKGGLPVLRGPSVDLIYLVEEEDFSDGKKIVKEGSHGKWIWVILEGTVTVTKETSMGPLPVMQLGEGCFIGTFASFLFQEHARSATVTAVGDVRLGLLDTQLLSSEFRLLSPALRGILYSMDSRLRKTTARLVDLALKKEVPVGLLKGTEVILNKGSVQEEAFTLVQGAAHVIGQSRRGSSYLLTLEKDDFFGNLPFLETGQEPHQAAIMASKEIVLNKLDVAGLHAEHDQLPNILQSMIHIISSSLAQTTKMVHRLHGEAPGDPK